MATNIVSFVNTLPPDDLVKSTNSLNSTDTLFSQPNQRLNATPNPDAHRILPQAYLGKYVPSSRSSRSFMPSTLTLPPPPPERSSSLRRKPVPNYLAMPSSLPSNHPFAAVSPPISVNSAASGGDSPATPNTMKMEEDLFFSPPVRAAPPPPLRRDFAPTCARSTASVPRTITPETKTGMPPATDYTQEVLEKESDNAKDEHSETSPIRPGTFHEGMEGGAPASGEETTDLAPPIEAGTASSTPMVDQTTFSPISNRETHTAGSSVASVNRLPLAHLSEGSVTTDDASTPIANPSTPAGKPSIPRRSSSEDSSAVPITPATTTASVHPSVRLTATGGKTWDIASEVDFFDGKTNHKAKQETAESRAPFFGSRGTPAPSPDPGAEEDDGKFSVDRIPTKRRLWEAGTCFVRDEDGQLICFGDLFPRWGEGLEGRVLPANASSNVKGQEMEKNAPASGESRRSPKTVLFFIRHFWCGQCQDYTLASVSQLDPLVLAAAGIRVIIISNGSWKIIKSYRKLFGCPFPIYVDGPRRLYKLLGMTKMTNFTGPLFKGRAEYHQRPVPTQLLHGAVNALTKLPFHDPGKLMQLGGEFVLAPGYTCELAHRMTNTSDHMEAHDVLRIAGCDAPTNSESAEIKFAESQKAELERMEREMKEWREGRASELERIRARKAARRGEIYTPPREASLAGLGLDEELGEGGFAEYHAEVMLEDANGEVGKDELDERFRRVMAMEETRGPERPARPASVGLGISQGKARPATERGIEVQVEG